MNMKDDGFSLLEVLVALAIFGILIVGLFDIRVSKAILIDNEVRIL